MCGTGKGYVQKSVFQRNYNTHCQKQKVNKTAIFSAV